MTVTLHFYSSRKIRENNFKIRQWPFSDKKRTRNNEGERWGTSRPSRSSRSARRPPVTRANTGSKPSCQILFFSWFCSKTFWKIWFKVELFCCLFFGIFWIAVVLKRFSELFLKVPTDFCVPMIFGWADKSIPTPTLWTDEDFCFNNMTDPVSKYFISFWASTCARKGEKGWERREKGGERRNQKRKLKDFLSGSL